MPGGLAGAVPRPGVRVRAGGATAIIGPGFAVLVAAEATHPVVEDIATAVHDEVSLLRLIGRLGRHDIEQLPGLGCVVVESAGCRVLLRGEVTASVAHQDGAQSDHDAGHRSTWHELALHDARTVTLDLPDPADRSEVTVLHGVALADGLSIDVASPAPRHDPPAAPRDSGHLGHARAAPTELDEPVDVVESGEHAAPGLQPTSAAATGAAPDLDEHHLFDGTVIRPPDEASTPPETAPDATVGEATGRSDPRDQSDPLTTEYRDEGDHAPAPPIAPAPPSRPAPAPPVPTDHPSPAPGTSGLIDWVPGSTRGPATLVTGDAPPTPRPPSDPQPTTHVEPSAGGDDGAADSLDAPTRHVGLSRPESVGPPVASVHCPVGHPNPPHADDCRRCGALISDRTSRTIPRPGLGALHFDDGTVVPLDGHLVIGRNPEPDASVNGEPATAVRFASPDSALSRTHAAIQLEDWQVLVIDRDSTNHTYVEIPGRAPFQLRPGEPYPLPPSARVRLGDEVTFTFEVEPA